MSRDWRCRPRLAALMLAALAFAACPGGDDDDSSGDPSASLEISFVGLADNDTVSQKVTLEASAAGGGGVTALRFVAPASLAAIDLDGAPDKLKGEYDTTLAKNGPLEVTVEATGADGSKTAKTLTLTTSNVSAAMKVRFTSGAVGDYVQDGDYVRNGSPLVFLVEASAFGSNPSLNKVEVRAVEGGGLAPALPLVGTPDGSAFKFNLGSPSEGEVSILMNAYNNDGEISEPLVLSLHVLRNDILSVYMPYDFEVSADGRTGFLLTSNPADPSSMRLEFIDLSIPASPRMYPEIISVKTGLSTSAVGNVLIPAMGDVGYVIFPSTLFYSFQMSTRQLLKSANLTTPLRNDPGAGIQHENRSPYGMVTPDGKYIFAAAATPGLVMIDTAAMAQVDGNPQYQGTTAFTFPLTTNPYGFGYMSIHPASTYVYLVNNWGSDTTVGTADLAVFDIAGKSFLDLQTRVQGTQGMVMSSLSTYLVAQQPWVTPDAYWLVAPISDRTNGRTMLKLFNISTPQSPVDTQTDLYLGDQLGLVNGTVAAASPDSHYVLLAGRDPDTTVAAVMDLKYSRVVSGLTFANGARDGAFSENGTRLFTCSANDTSRTLGVVDLSLTAPVVTDIDVPGGTGLAPPNPVSNMKYDLVVRNGNYLYQLYSAYVPDASGNILPAGTSLSVYDITAGGFVFPNPIE